MTNLARRFWEDIQIGIYGSIIASVLRLFTGNGPAYALSHFWQSLLWLVPASFVGTELARGLHAVIHSSQAIWPFNQAYQATRPVNT